MNKYISLQSSNEYINFTLKNYIDCYDDLETDEIQRLTEVFNLFKTHKVSLGNQLVDNKALYGVKLEAVEKKELYRSTSDLNNQLSILGNNVDAKDKKDTLFFQSITHLCDAVQYLSSEEMMDLNDMFQSLSNHKQAIGQGITDKATSFYPYDRASKKYTK